MAPQKPRAYSYVRFSSPEQAKGDSLRRQTALAEQYAAAHGLELDTTLSLRDLGISAFRGDNVATGALGAFLDAIRQRLVPKGSYLLVESLDRVSRKQARKAVRILEEVVEAGITVVTLNDGKAYTEESLDGADFLVAIILLMRSHEESATKSGRLKAAWSNKRERAKMLEVQTRRVPAWVEADESRRLSLNEERAALVRRMFELFLAGTGKKEIAATFNREGIPTWGAGLGRTPGKHWHASYIFKILTNPAVRGAYVPHVEEYNEHGKRRRVPLDVVNGYYPAAVDENTFTRAQALMKGHGTPSTGRGVVSLVAGLAKCPKCGSTMTRVVKGKKGGPARLLCVKAKASAGCEYQLVRLADVESAIVNNADTLAAPPILDDELADLIRGAVQALEETSQQVDALISAIERKPSAALSKRLAIREAEVERIAAELKSLRDRELQAGSAIVRHRAKRLSAALSWHAIQPADVEMANAAMRECFESITVDYDAGDLRLNWRQGGVTALAFRT